MCVPHVEILGVPCQSVYITVKSVKYSSRSNASWDMHGTFIGLNFY